MREVDGFLLGLLFWAVLFCVAIWLLNRRARRQCKLEAFKDARAAERLRRYAAAQAEPDYEKAVAMLEGGS